MVVLVLMMMLVLMFEVLPLCRRGRVGEVVWKRRFGEANVLTKSKRDKNIIISFLPPLVESLRLLWG